MIRIYEWEERIITCRAVCIILLGVLLGVDFGVSRVFPLRRMLVMSSDSENGVRCRRDPKNNTGDESGSGEVGIDDAKEMGVIGS
jgi:hypothetical protein